jgi:formylglycine-generating enzyme required for sulfatase activity
MARFLFLNPFSVWLAALACLPLGGVANAEPIEWVTVGDPGNTADIRLFRVDYGAVAASFRIMKYEITNQQYTDFLNSVAATDTYSLYNQYMGSDASFRGGITQSGSAGSYTYSAKTNMGDKPVNYVSWFDAARMSNWLMNGATSSSSTERGAYTLVSGQTSGTAPAVNSVAMFYVPTIHQSYKAAFYKGGGTDAGYWDFATQSDAGPEPVKAGLTGIGSAGSTGNFANYNRGADWNGQIGNVTTVGTNGGPSSYGAFDMSGNVFEWIELTGAAGSGPGFRGGDWYTNLFYQSANSVGGTLDPSYEGYDIGFRLASPVSPSAVPEIDPNGLSAVLGLLVGGLGLLERRRYGR